MSKKKAVVSKEYVVRMRVEFNNALAFVTAESPEEARLKASRAEWHDLEIEPAEMINWEPLSVEENE